MSSTSWSSRLRSRSRPREAPGFSLDALIGWDDNISGLWWGVGVIGLSALATAATLTVGRRSGKPTAVPSENRGGEAAQRAA